MQPLPSRSLGQSSSFYPSRTRPELQRRKRKSRPNSQARMCRYGKSTWRIMRASRNLPPKRTTCRIWTYSSPTLAWCLDTSPWAKKAGRLVYRSTFYQQHCSGFYWCPNRGPGEARIFWLLRRKLIGGWRLVTFLTTPHLCSLSAKTAETVTHSCRTRSPNCLPCMWPVN
ncbi:hypothetical protein BDY17DRAFT_100047 [Neohortaea acidophila]|uniref:Uncharacterized protein n=1 Tax=Neohortaea acidophila TaxID=245834 RepID=A0A6A6PZ39_9PEZI|nr:uncharacterized protein BDY17DRAFT_100047 [Neohortaea acidophila]KAF2485285.1 hypothetical protein BDY17DRAFT_100047 [Neohortaea acidophila]